MMRAAIYSLAFVLCAACSASPGDGAYDGIIADGNTVFTIPPTPNANTLSQAIAPPTVHPLDVAGVAFIQDPVDAGIAGSHLQVVFNSTPDACADVNTNTLHIGEVQLAITLTDIKDSSVIANTYTYPAQTSAQFQILSATYAVVEAGCYYNYVSLQSGTVNLTTSTNTSFSGTYSLTFSSGTIGGSFNTTNSCPALSAPPVDTASCD